MESGTCAQCGEEKPIVARGLCGRCYTGLRRVGKLERYPSHGQRGRPRQRQHAINWRAIADARQGEIDRLRARVAELEQKAR